MAAEPSPSPPPEPPASSASACARAELVQAFLDDSPFPISLCDLDGRFQIINRLGAELIGRPREQILGHSAVELYGRETAETIARRELAVRRGGETAVFEIPGRAPDGSSREYLVTKYPVRDANGEIVGVGGISLDITARKEIENQLREAEDRFRGAFDAATIGKALVSPDGRFLQVNPALCELFGYTEEELLAVSFQELTHPEDLDADLDLVRQMLAGEIQTYHLDKRYVHRLGHTLWARLSVSLVRDAGGAPLHFVSQIQDIGQQRQAEELAEQLRHSQKLDAIGRLAGGVAHDFNNMLTAIRGYSELLLGGLDEGDPLRRYAVQISRAAEQAATLPRQLLAFSRREAWQPRPVDVNEVLTEATDMLGRLVGESIELVVTPRAQSGTVQSDPGHLEQVLLNLAINAGEAMPGGGTVRISTRNALITGKPHMGGVDARGGRYVVLAVSDEGEGMSAETKARAFEPFFTTKVNGSGLGLATVYGIVSQSDGFVHIYSRPSQGSIVEVWLPCLDVGAGGLPEGPEGEPVADPDRKAGRVLVVEDEELVRDLTVAVLERAGYSVMSAGDGDRALELLDESEHGIDVLLSDMVMPGMSGGELARRVTALEPDSQVLLMSGYTDELMAPGGDGATLGANFLQKPFAADALLESVAERVGHRPAVAEDLGRASGADLPEDLGWASGADLPEDPAVITCLVADDHPAVLDAVVSYLEHNQINVVAGVAGGDEALAAIVAHKPAIALLDVRMEPFSGIEVARRALTDAPATRCVLYTGHSDRALLKEALDAGARGFVRKEAPMAELLQAITTVFGGDTYVDAELAADLASGAAENKLSPLTDRERQILAMVADGMTNDKVAAALGISPETVQSHVRHAMAKLDSETRTQAVATALRRSLLV